MRSADVKGSIPRQAASPPPVVTSPERLRATCDEARARGERVGVVPTMGALHEGHLSLVAEAARRADVVVVTIFVNPTQFGPGEDFARYPRDLPSDVRKLTGASLVFAPDPSAIYRDGDETRVRVGALAEGLCGAHRPGHFEGVATVVTKLLNIVGPCSAVFGRKDYQQLAVVRRVAQDLFIPVDVVGAALVREADGLAMSSRNVYLSADERVRALGIVRGLQRAWKAFTAGERRAGALRGLAETEVRAAASRVDYVTVADADTLAPFPDDAEVGERAVLAVACHVGKTRLIDNVVFGEDDLPQGR